MPARGGHNTNHFFTSGLPKYASGNLRTEINLVALPYFSSQHRVMQAVRCAALPAHIRHANVKNPCGGLFGDPRGRGALHRECLMGSLLVLGFSFAVGSFFRMRQMTEAHISVPHLHTTVHGHSQRGAGGGYPSPYEGLPPSQPSKFAKGFELIVDYCSPIACKQMKCYFTLRYHIEI